jgi:hypothetical protein
MATPGQDWFAQNAPTSSGASPSRSAGGDWFASNPPQTTQQGQPEQHGFLSTLGDVGVGELRNAFPYDSAPGYLIFDRGASFNEEAVFTVKSFGI